MVHDMSMKKTKVNDAVTINDLRVEHKKLVTLVPAPYNPRKIDAETRMKLKQSIDEFGMMQPIVWNATTGRIVGGHQRLQALYDLGIESTDVIVVELDEARERAANLVMNKVGGEWDNEKLKALFIELRDDFHFDDIKITGFDEDEIERVLQSWDQIGENDPHSLWRGMPEFGQDDLNAFRSLIVHFATAEDVKAFSDLIHQQFGEKAKYIWFPEQKREKLKAYEFGADQA